MPAVESTTDDDDSELLALLASLELTDDNLPALPPRTPSPGPARSRSDSRRTIGGISPGSSNLYVFDSPTRRGVTTEWSLAGAATQGVPQSHVRALHPNRPKHKKTRKKAAYVVFCGKRCGVYLTWPETERLVSGVRSCIYRGYITVPEARAAFAYAEAHGWTRVADPTIPPRALSSLPLPVGAAGTEDNPLNGNEALDDRWFVVYRGICPGVYRSHLECQLNTLGVKRSLHEAIVGKAAALDKYAIAHRSGVVSCVPPTYYADLLAPDTFL